MKPKTVVFIAPLGGYASICLVARTPEGLTRNGLEAPFMIYWEDDSETEGTIYIPLYEIKDSPNPKALLSGIKTEKVAAWVKERLLTITIPRENRVDLRAGMREILTWM